MASDESILQEAERLINGERRGSYGHPLDNFTNTADLLNVFLRAKLKESLSAEDVATIMVLLKLAREMNQHKRDNLVDAAGYLGCLEKVIDERANRLALLPSPNAPQETDAEPRLNGPDNPCPDATCRVCRPRGVSETAS